MINKVILIGNLGADPEMRFTQSGTAVANFRIATSERFKDQSGEWQERTEWHRVVFFGRIAEVCGEYLTKGRQIYVEGRLQTRSWEDKDGVTRYTTEVGGPGDEDAGKQGRRRRPPQGRRGGQRNKPFPSGRSSGAAGRL